MRPSANEGPDIQWYSLPDYNGVDISMTNDTIATVTLWYNI